MDPDPTDLAFLGPHPAWVSLPCSPAVPDGFIGLALAGPERLSYSSALTGEGLYGGQKLPQFIVAGHFCFDPEQLRALSEEPLQSIELEITDRRAGSVIRRGIGALVDDYEYEAIGISSSPGPTAVWEPTRDAGLVSMGGYFNIPMGLLVTNPGDRNTPLEVVAVCAGIRSNRVIITVSP